MATLRTAQCCQQQHAHSEVQCIVSHAPLPPCEFLVRKITTPSNTRRRSGTSRRRGTVPPTLPPINAFNQSLTVYIVSKKTIDVISRPERNVMVTNGERASDYEAARAKGLMCIARWCLSSQDGRPAMQMPHCSNTPCAHSRSYSSCASGKTMPAS